MKIQRVTSMWYSGGGVATWYRCSYARGDAGPVSRKRPAHEGAKLQEQHQWEATECEEMRELRHSSAAFPTNRGRDWEGRQSQS